jgi:hypothetical protein
VWSKCRAISNAIQKYGWNTFTTVVLCTCASLEQANKQESKLIEEHNTLAPHGYNLRTGGESHVLSEESRELIRVARQGTKMTAETRAKMQIHWDNRKDIPRSDAVVEKIRKGMIGKIDMYELMNTNKNCLKLAAPVSYCLKQVKKYVCNALVKFGLRTEYTRVY